MALSGRLARVGQQPAAGQAWGNPCWKPTLLVARPYCRCSRARRVAVRAQQGTTGEWWQSLNRRNLQGPDPPEPPYEPTDQESLSRLRMGDKGYALFERMKREERQRVWDAMRRVAKERWEAGAMPPWFNPKWLDIQEAPTNTWWRQQGLSEYQMDPTWLGDDGGDGSSGGGGPGKGGSSNGSGSGWWREDDPYWPLRDWGDHPMRWWTWGFAGLLAAGGLFNFLRSGISESVWVGFGAAALLSVCAMAMSDIRDELEMGEAAVKAAWATCLLLAAKEYWWGWQHKPQKTWFSQRQPHLEGSGWSAIGMCVLYMLSGMSGLWHYSLPTNPGEAFKMVDVAQKSMVWSYWGYGDQGMRG